MARTVLVKEAIWRASALLLDNAPQFNRYSEKNLVDWLNDGQMALAKFCPMSVARLDTLKFFAGTHQSIATIASNSILPGDGSGPVITYGMTLLDVVRDMGTDGMTPGLALRRGERRILDAAVPGWHLQVATVPSTWSFDPALPTEFFLSPGLRQQRWLQVSWVPQPAKLPSGAVGAELYAFAGTSTATLSVHDQYLDDLVNYIAARANMAADEIASQGDAAMFTQAFVSSLNGYMQATTGTNPNLKALPFAPAPVARAAL